MGKRRISIILFLILFVSVVIAIEIDPVKADTTIYIKQNGEIESTELIERKGNIYQIIGNINDPIIIERNDIILDGNGYTLGGSGFGWAINLTTSNVTVRNIHIEDWDTGILGVFNDNKILGNVITGCNFSIRIYADNYSIVSNYITNNDRGILLQGSMNLVSNNNITDNNVGVEIFGHVYNFENDIVENTISFNENGIYVRRHLEEVKQRIYRNNFINNTIQVKIYVSPLPISLPTIASTWNNGLMEGNYWSDYNGTDSNIDGIGDTFYEIGESNTDIYPLMAPMNVDVIPEFPSWIILPLFIVAPLVVMIVRTKLSKKD